MNYEIKICLSAIWICINIYLFNFIMDMLNAKSDILVSCGGILIFILIIVNASIVRHIFNKKKEKVKNEEIKKE